MKRILLGFVATAGGLWVLERLRRRMRGRAADRRLRAPAASMGRNIAATGAVSSAVPIRPITPIKPIASDTVLGEGAADLPAPSSADNATPTGPREPARPELELVLAPPPEFGPRSSSTSVPAERKPGILEPDDFGRSAPTRAGALVALIADDDRDIRTLAAHLLERAGYEVLTAADGDEALQLALDHRPAVCILDWMMPKRNGLEVLESLRAGTQTAATPVLLLTARAAMADMEQGLKAGADGYLTKPFTAAELRERVEALVELRAA